MHFDSLTTMAGRHLLASYLVVAGVQLGYVALMIRNWRRLNRR